MSSGTPTLEEQHREMLAVCRSERYRSATGEEQREILWEAISRYPYQQLPPVTFSFLIVGSCCLASTPPHRICPFTERIGERPKSITLTPAMAKHNRKRNTK
jgi:hypothetical protein